MPQVQTTEDLQQETNRDKQNTEQNIGDKDPSAKN